MARVLKCKKRIKKQLDVKIVCLCYTSASQKCRSSRILIQKDNFLFSRLITWQVKHFKPFLLFSLFAFSSWEVRHLVYQIIRIFPMTCKWTVYTALFYYQSTLCKMPRSPIHISTFFLFFLLCSSAFCPMLTDIHTLVGASESNLGIFGVQSGIEPPTFIVSRWPTLPRELQPPAPEQCRNVQLLNSQLGCNSY